ncbi:type III-B CRISPR module RAMP protein Cmr6 [candidate division KSB1 bacterium]|nr:type III-B CRISPR module RAMP protein Cmr6 [candidate division KSB1 bacterium]
MTVYTSRNRYLPNIRCSDGISPSLAIMKFQGYDCFQKTPSNKRDFSHNDTRVSYLKEIAIQVQKVNKSRYLDWFDHYQNTISQLGNINFYRYKTIWRFICGFAENPALETGITLHHLYGFPYIPGSSVKGLLHYMADKDLAEKFVHFSRRPASELIANLKELVEIAEHIICLFGSLCNADDRENKEPMTLFINHLHSKRQALTDLGEEGQSLLSRICWIDKSPTGGVLCCYDAVPAPDSFNETDDPVLQTDIFNPHYPEYYNSKGEKVPSDDQNPKPIHFLAVKPGTTFIFPFRLEQVRNDSEDDPFLQHRLEIIRSYVDMHSDIKRWLKKGLEEWGIGAKTASGYGYFEPVQEKS